MTLHPLSSCVNTYHLSSPQQDMPSHKHLKQLSTDASRRAYNSYITNIISPDSTENPKRFWGFIKGLRTENTGIVPLKDSTGMTQSDDSKKADILNCIPVNLWELLGGKSPPYQLF